MLLSSVEEHYEPYVNLVYVCVDRIYLRGYVPLLQRCGGFRTWAERLRPDQPVTQGWIQSLARRFHDNVKTYAQERELPLLEAQSKRRKQEIAQQYREQFDEPEGVYLILKSREKAKTYVSSEPKTPSRHKPNHRNLRRREGFVTHYYFYLLDPFWGDVCVAICSHPPFGVKVFLNGHYWVRSMAQRQGLELELDDNAFRTTEDPRALQTLCDQLHQRDIQRVADRWVYRLLPILSQEQRISSRFRYAWSNAQMELAHNLVFDPAFPLDELFHRHIDWNRRLLGPKTITTIFGGKKTRPSRDEVSLFTPFESLTVLRVKHGRAILKQYDKHGYVLRTECVSNDPRQFGVGKRLTNFQALRSKMAQTLARFLTLQRSVTHSTLGRGQLAALAQTSELGKARVPGIRLDNERLITVLHLLGQLATQPRGVRAGQLREAFVDRTALAYSAAQASYDLRKLRAKGLLLPVETSRYVFSDSGTQVAALLVKLHDLLLEPALAATDPPPKPIPPKTRRPGPAPRPVPARLVPLLRRHHGNVTRTAQELRENPSTVRRWIRRDSISLETFRHPVPSPDRETAYRELDHALDRVAKACDLSLLS